MKFSVFIILMVIQAITCEKAVSKLRRKLIVPKMDEKCKKIKCAAVDEPLCVRMGRYDLHLTIHIIAANECELEYMKCHDDLEAKAVPMKYCSHSLGDTNGKKKNKPGKAHIRMKRRVKAFNKHIQRQAESETTTTEQPRTGLKDHNNKSKHHKLKKLRIKSKKISQLKNEDSNFIPKGNDNRTVMKGHAAGRQDPQTMGYPFSSETDSDLEINEIKKINKGIAGHLVGVEEEDASPSMQHLPFQPKAFMSPSMIGMKGPYPLSQDKDESQYEEINSSESQEHSPEIPMISKEAVNFSKETLTEADKQEHESLCPSICPSRDVMVCGKCQHGVYKTFLSVCHLRMFACIHEDETLQLIARYPCVLSAPYISESYGKPKAKVHEADDYDKILRFIICRDGGKLGTEEKPSDDPRCNFRATKEKLKYYDYKGVERPLDSHLILNDDTEY